jgi:DNA-binding winged helix-turn-helix (wHTH) protein/tetratricopeptide (TPR) repeat protein
MLNTDEVASSGERYRFGLFEFDAPALELIKDGRVVRIRPQSLKLLHILVAKPGDVVSRDQIQYALWGSDNFVDFEQGVNHAIRELRSVLGDSADSPRFIQTLARRGYRFIAPVERLTFDPRRPIASRHPTPESADSSAPQHAIESPAGLRSRIQSGGIRHWILAAGVILTCATVLALAVRPWTNRSEPIVDGSAVAVVPFSSAGADSSLGTGLAIAISTRLGGQQRTSVRWTPAAPSDGASPGRWSDADLRGAALVLSGDVFRTGPVVVVAARLENVATGAVVWTEKFEARADELHNLENVIAERVVDALDLRIAAAEQERLRRRDTRNPAAYEAYLRGRAELVRYTPQSTLAAIDAFESALQQDPSYALARAGLAMACADMCLRFAPPGDVERWGQRAETESRAALDLDPNLAEAHLARAAVARKREFDWHVVVDSSRRALVLNPNLDQAHYFIAAAFYHAGYMEEALIEVERGLRLRGPDALEPIRTQGLIAMWSGSYAPARVHLEEVSRRSDQAMGDTYLAQAYYYTGSVDQALTRLRTLADSSSASTASRAGSVLAAVLGSRGDNRGARERLEIVLSREYRDHHVAYNLGTAYAQLGDVSEALRWLRTAADTGFPCFIWFERDPLLDPIRGDAKFAELLAHVRTMRETALR